MSYYEQSRDPYESYDPPSAQYAAEDSFEFFDEGIDPYIDDSLYLSDTPGDVYDDETYDYEYDEMYNGDMYDDEDQYYQDDWLPLPPDEIPIETISIENRPEDYGEQLYIGGLQHPDPASVRDSYCQFYPEACEEGAGLSGREPFNKTEVAEELDRTLKDVDMTGLAIAAVLLLILLFGLHYGGNSPDAASSKDPTPSDPAAKKIRERLKAAGYTDPDLAKRVSDTMKLPEDKREEEINRLIRDKYKARLEKRKIEEPDLTKALDEIMAAPEGEEREKKYQELLKKHSIDPDYAKYKELLRAAGIKEPKLTENLKEIMALPADKRAVKCQAIIDAPRPASGSPSDSEERAKYREKLTKAGIDGSDRSKKLDEIMTVPTSEREAKCDAIIKASKPPSSAPPPGNNAAPAADTNGKSPPKSGDTNGADPDAADRKKYKEKLEKQGHKPESVKSRLDDIMSKPAADREARFAAITKADEERADKDKFKKALEAAGVAEPTLSKRVSDIMKKPKEERDAELARIIAKETGSTPPDGDKPMTRDELDAALKGYGYTDDAQRSAIVDALANRSLGTQKSKLESYKKSKEDEEALWKKLQEAGVTDENQIKKYIRGLLPKSEEEREKDIAKIKERNDLKKALEKDLTDAGYKDKQERDGIIRKLLDIPDTAKRNEELQKYKDRKKGNQGEPPKDDTAAKAEKAKKAKESIVEQLRSAGGTDEAEMDRMAEDVLSQSGSDARRSKLRDHIKDIKSRKNQPGGPTPPNDPPVNPLDENGSNPQDDSRNDSSWKPLSNDEFKQKLVKCGYPEPALTNMLEAYKAAPSTAAKKAIYDELITNDRDKREANLAKYTKPGQTNNGSGKIKDRAALDALLKGLGYSDGARKRMGDQWEATSDPAQRDSLVGLWKNKDNKQKYEDRYKDEGLTQLSSADAAKLNDILKGLGYDEHTRKKMIEAWHKAPNNIEREKIYKQITSEDPDIVAQNKVTYGSKGSGPTDPSTFILPPDNEILNKLKDAGFTDEDARKEILRRIKESDPKDQIGWYNKFTKPGAGTPEENKKYGDRWRKNNPKGPKLSPEDQEIDDALKQKGYSDDARKRMISELNDPTNKDNKAQMLSKWLNAEGPEMEEINKQKANEQAAIDVDRARGGKGKGRDGSPTDPQSDDGGGGPWITGPQLMFLGLLIIPLLLIMSRGMSTPSGQSYLRMPTIPSLRGPWSEAPMMAGGIPITTGLPELSSKRKTRTRKPSSPRMAVSHGSSDSGPAININNVNSQGRDIPIDINSSGGGAVMEETVVEETMVEGVVAEKVVVEEQIMVEEPAVMVVEKEEQATIEFQGPSDPNRLFWMFAAAIIASMPLVMSYMTDWKPRVLSETEYLSALIHWVVLVVATLFLLLKIDRSFHWSSRYARPIARATRKLPGIVSPLIVGTVEGTEALIWGVDDAVFGKSQELLGLVLAAVVFCVTSMSAPFDDPARGDYSETMSQFMPIFGIALIAFLFHNAAQSVYY